MKSVVIHGKSFEVFLSSEAIQTRIKAMAEALNEKFQQTNPIFISILNGSVFFAADLIRLFRGPCEITFIQLASYEGTTSTQEIKTIMPFKSNFGGRKVIVLEDIVDTGLTMNHLLQLLAQESPESIDIVTLLDKPSRRLKDVNMHLIGFTIPDRFVVGYGLDYNEQGRNLDDIYSEIH